MNIKTIENVWVVVDKDNQIMPQTNWYNEKDANIIANNIRQHVSMFREFSEAMPVAVQKVNINFEVVE